MNDESTVVKVARVEEKVDAIKETLGDLKVLLEKHISDDANNFTALRNQMYQQKSTMDYVKGYWGGICLVVLMIWNVYKVFHN